MTINQDKAVKKYFITRSISAICDEMWLICLPFYFAKHLSDNSLLGLNQSFNGLGEVIGFLLLPILSQFFRTGVIAIFIDTLQFLIMMTIAVLSYLGLLNPSVLIAWSFFVRMIFAVWFGSSDTLISSVTAKKKAEVNQKYIVLANNAAPVVGPLLGGIMFQFINIGGVAFINAISFFMQAVTLKSIDQILQVESKHITFKDSLKSGLNSIVKNPVMYNLVFFSICIKVLLLSIPFIVFKLKNAGYEAAQIGILVSTMGVGTILGASTYIPKGDEKLARSFSITGPLMVLFGIVSIGLSLINDSIWKLYLCFGVWGFFVSRYQIQARSLRQLTVDQKDFPTQIAAMGLLTRLFNPLSGIIFVWLFSGKISILIILLVIIVLLYFSIKCSKIISNNLLKCSLGNKK